MIKKIALTAIFALVSVVSFSSSSVNAAKPAVKDFSSVGSPVMKGICSKGPISGKC